MKKDLKRDIKYFENLSQIGPTQREIEKIYLKNVEKLIGVINDFERKEGITVNGYLCVIDEIYPNIEEVLQSSSRILRSA